MIRYILLSTQWLHWKNMYYLVYPYDEPMKLLSLPLPHMMNITLVLSKRLWLSSVSSNPVFFTVTLVLYKKEFKCFHEWMNCSVFIVLELSWAGTPGSSITQMSVFSTARHQEPEDTGVSTMVGWRKGLKKGENQGRQHWRNRAFKTGFK